MKAVRRIALIVCAAMLSAALTVWAPPSVSAAATPVTRAVPAEFRDLFVSLDGALTTLAPDAHDMRAVPAYPKLVCSNLLSANSNSLPDIADSPANLATVQNTLDAYAEIGINSVDITLQYPTLVSGFPRSADYLAYYKAVVGEARKRDMKVVIGVQATFTSPVFARLPVADWYTDLTKERYMAEKRQMLETVIKELAPDYLTLENEPGTQHMNLGIDYSVEDAKTYVGFFLKDLDHGGVKIGSGAGLWDEWGYWEYYLNNPGIDYLDLHIYPVNDPDLKTKIEKISSEARKNGKSVIIGESWLYKTDGRENTGGAMATAAKVFGRDPYSFWAPLDCKFIDTMMALADANDWELVSFFWGRYFFSYLEYRSAPRDVAQRFALVQRNATRNIYAGRLSPTGEYLMNILVPR